MLQLPAALEQPLNEIRENTRLRCGIWLIVAILLLYGFMQLNLAVAIKETAYFDAAKRISSLESVKNQTEWLDRAAKGKSLRVQLESRLWRSSSKGLAQATFQSWIEKQASTYRLNNVRITMQPVEELGTELSLWRVSANVSGEFRAGAFERFVSNVEKNPQIVVIDMLTLRNGRRPLFNSTMTAWFYGGSVDN